MIHLYTIGLKKEAERQKGQIVKNLGRAHASFDDNVDDLDERSSVLAYMYYHYDI